MEKTSVPECKTGSTGEPTVIALNKRNYLRRWLQVTSAGEGVPCTNIQVIEQARSRTKHCIYMQATTP